MRVSFDPRQRSICGLATVVGGRGAMVGGASKSCTTVAALISILLMRAATVVQRVCKSCRTCFKFYCIFYFTCDRSFSSAYKAGSLRTPRLLGTKPTHRPLPHKCETHITSVYPCYTSATARTATPTREPRDVIGGTARRHGDWAEPGPPPHPA